MLDGEGLSDVLVVDGPDGLAGVLEGRIVDVHLDHREQGGQWLVEGHEIAQLLLHQIADHALRLRAQDVQRIWRHLRVGRALQSQQAHLRPVPVRDDQLVLNRDRRQLLAGDADVVALVVAAHGLTPSKQGIATQGDDDSHVQLS